MTVRRARRLTTTLASISIACIIPALALGGHNVFTIIGVAAVLGVLGVGFWFPFALIEAVNTDMPDPWADRDDAAS